jgi:hypothetical protein
LVIGDNVALEPVKAGDAAAIGQDALPRELESHAESAPALGPSCPIPDSEGYGIHPKVRRRLSRSKRAVA